MTATVWTEIRWGVRGRKKRGRREYLWTVYEKVPLALTEIDRFDEPVAYRNPADSSYPRSDLAGLDGVLYAPLNRWLGHQVTVEDFARIVGKADGTEGFDGRPPVRLLNRAAPKDRIVDAEFAADLAEVTFSARDRALHEAAKSMGDLVAHGGKVWRKAGHPYWRLSHSSALDGVATVRPVVALPGPREIGRDALPPMYFRPGDRDGLDDWVRRVDAIGLRAHWRFDAEGDGREPDVTHPAYAGPDPLLPSAFDLRAFMDYQFLSARDAALAATIDELAVRAESGTDLDLPQVAALMENLGRKPEADPDGPRPVRILSRHDFVLPRAAAYASSWLARRTSPEDEAALLVP